MKSSHNFLKKKERERENIKKCPPPLQEVLAKPLATSTISIANL